MGPIETLVNEHGLIRHFLANLEMAGERIETGNRPPRQFLENAVEFARTFADAYHHIKEEHILFVRLAQKKKGEIDAHLGVLRHQHERCRELVTAIAGLIDGYAEGDPSATSEVLVHIGAYVSLLRHHIHIEDHVFFPLARKELDLDDLKRLCAEFERERQRTGGTAFEACDGLVCDMGSMILLLPTR